MPHHDPLRVLRAPLAILLFFGANACDRPQETPRAAYDCPDGRVITVRYHSDSASVTFKDGIGPARTLALPQTIAASGARYSDDRITVWNKGAVIHVQEPGQAAVTCRESANSPKRQ